ncbi:ATPase [Planctomonas deserti]|uniref:ATPase n=1 Tax=Planctomonas deserti TaxID=2144185 RepID=UPI000D34465E|nr:ATPase [Planctomonas deserti]
MQQRSEAILIGGRSGVGKSTAAFRLHGILSDRDVPHAVIEGDALDLAHPAPWEHGLAERNLAALWGNYRALGYHRLIYTNTVSVLQADVLAAAMGDDPRVTAVLLRASDDTAAGRLAGREEGEELERHVGRSRTAARRLDEQAGASVHRIDTDGRTPTEIAVAILRISGWV